MNSDRLAKELVTDRRRQTHASVQPRPLVGGSVRKWVKLSSDCPHWNEEGPGSLDLSGKPGPFYVAVTVGFELSQ